MGVTYSISGGVLTIALAGTYEPDEVITRFREALDDPACPTPVGLLIDTTLSESLATRPPEDIARVSQYLAPFAARVRGRCAVVAPTDVLYGLSRMAGTYAEMTGIDAQVFRDAESALEWLRGGEET